MAPQCPIIATPWSRLAGRRGALLLLCLLLCVALPPQPGHAQGPSEPPPSLLLRPDPEGAATEVLVELNINDILSINEREETFELDAYLYAEWVDPRLRFDAAVFGSDHKVYRGEAALEALKTQIWWPELELVGGRGPRDRLHLSLLVWDDGVVEYEERFRAFIKQPYDLEEFPFDAHTIQLAVESFNYQVDEVTFADPEEGRYKLEWETNDWEILGAQAVIELPTPDDEEPYARALFEIDIERIPTFYLTKFILPLLLIVAISWAVFWMDFDTMHLADRLSVSFTSVLTVVAFDFVSAGNLPRLVYPTRLDAMLIVSYLFLALTVLENVVSHSLMRSGQATASRRLDLTSRWLFPLAYFLSLIVAFYVL